LLVGLDELDDEHEVLASIALALASKLDDSALSDSGAVAMATAGIAKELRAVIAALTDDPAAKESFIAALFT
jgi:hypothetical protein